MLLSHLLVFLKNGLIFWVARVREERRRLKIYEEKGRRDG